MPRLTEATRSARQEHILQTAVRCFARAGYHGTAMEEIAAEAGIAKGAAYVYFPSKEAIFLALYESWDCTLQEEITSAIAAMPTAERASARRVLRVIVEVNGQHVKAHAEACRVLLEGRALAAYIPSIGARVRDNQHHGQAGLEQLLRAGIEAGEWPADLDVPLRARLLRAAIHGLMVSWHSEPVSVDWEAAGEALADW
ncbi:MAG TPA: TetR/AcrR family transcriptional regulator [Ktedonobacterales bacterium]|jgi:TetR/AcrR family acrAB operon transcriptional repressor|nr:TetR/AcrR family transcriptional regulator [Ktedonobacterales bacterium]